MPDRDGGVDGTSGLPVDQVEGFGDRIRRRLLGRPLLASEITGERLAKPTALAVFSSDCISSSAYATEEILRVLIPAAGIAGFALLLPITTAMVVVLFFLVLSYRQTITAYPTAGGAYMVTRDNFGLIPAQVAGVSLLTDYVLTVAVSVAAGTDAISSAAPSLAPYHVVIAAAFIVLIAYGNLRGMKDAGRVFAVPTYAFITMMGLILGLAVLKQTGLVGGHLAVQNVTHLKGAIPVGHGAVDALLYGATLYVILHAFASGGAALTGVEAISNGVSAFRTPQARNARTTLVIMGVVLGTIFLGVSAIAAKVHAIPYVSGAPTVISQVGRAAFGKGSMADVLFYALQISTTAILVLAANTSFADFPRLANFHAHDDFMPRQLTVKGYRLVFSNGILALATAAMVLLLVTGASVDRLIPLYAIGVFTSFTLSQAGMAKRHLTRREEGWRYGLTVNGIGALLSGAVDIVILITKFTHGAWIILVIVPALVLLLVRLNKEYRAENERLAVDVSQISSLIGLDDWAPGTGSALRPDGRRRVVLVPVGRLDASIVAPLRHALRLGADDIIAVHASIDPDAAKELAHEWPRAGLDRLPLEVVEAPGRRVGPPLESVARAWAEREVDVEVVLPLRVYRSSGWPLVHHRNARKILREVVGIPGVIVTTVPFLVGTPRQVHPRPHPEITGPPLRINDRVALEGVVVAVEWSPDSKRARRGTVKALIEGDRGMVLAEWSGRRHPADGEPLPEARVRIEGLVRPAEHVGGPLVLVNPRLTIIRPAAPEEEPQQSPH
jgi:amino acid transporter